MTAALNGIAALDDWGVIRAEGEDAARFLHGQLTQDFALLGLSEARLAALCNAKGRMLASFIGCRRSGGDILLVCRSDILAATLKRLSMFVLRAKVRLSDASTAFQLYGAAGPALAALADAQPAPWQALPAGPGHLIGLYPAAGTARALWIAPAGEALPPVPVLAPALWAWSEVRSGIAPISAPIVEAFVPQMLNYESVDGVSFKKGCYPGQEVVARSQFRGTLKRRAYLVHTDAALQAGQEVFHDGDATQPCGLVALAAPAPDSGWEAIVSLQTAAASDGGLLTAGSPTGPQLRLLPLPYPLRDDL